VEDLPLAPGPDSAGPRNLKSRYASPLGPGEGTPVSFILSRHLEPVVGIRVRKRRGNGGPRSSERRYDGLRELRVRIRVGLAEKDQRRMCCSNAGRARWAKARQIVFEYLDVRELMSVRQPLANQARRRRDQYELDLLANRLRSKTVDNGPNRCVFVRCEDHGQLRLGHDFRAPICGTDNDDCQPPWRNQCHFRNSRHESTRLRAHSY